MATATQNNSSLKDAMDEFFRRGLSDQQVYYKFGQATEINTTEYTFTFVPLDGTANVVDVKMKTVANGDKDDFFIAVPKEGSSVIVIYETPITAFCVLAKEVEEFLITCNDVKVTTDSWVFNGGENEGLINIVGLTEKLNDLTDKVNDLITKYNAHVHTGVTTGAGVSSVTTSIETPAIPFNKDDYEDTRILH